MKPRTKAQIEVFNLSKIVLDVANKIKDWAYEVCNEHIGLAVKKHFWCIDCGAENSTTLIENNKVVCPNCDRILTIQKSLKRKYHQYYYVGFAEVLGDYQVIRLFEVVTNSRKNEKATCFIQENVMQFIPSDHSKIQYVARVCNQGGYEPRYGELEVRKPSCYRENNYNPYPCKFHPLSCFKKEYEKIGINHELQGLSFLNAYRSLIYKAKSETLLKAKQFSLFGKTLNSYDYILNYWGTIKIAMRNRYVVDDAGMWFDYLELLDFFRKDLRNPKYVCPVDLRKEHDKYVARKSKIDKKAELKERLKRLNEEQNEYSKKIKDFIGLQFSSGKLTIKVLETIQEFIDESEIHKHCVYSNKYYNRKDSLIFSAVYDGKKVETVEVSTRDFEIVQSRGFQNKASKYNKEVIELVKNNMFLIKQRLGSDLQTA